MSPVDGAIDGLDTGSVVVVVPLGLDLLVGLALLLAICYFLTDPNRRVSFCRLLQDESLGAGKASCLWS